MSHAGAPRSPLRSHEGAQVVKARPAWRTWVVRILTVAFFALVAVLLVRQARTIEWTTVGQTLRSYRPGTLALAAAVGLTSYAVYAGYELVARRYSGHTLPVPLTAAVGAARVKLLVASVMRPTAEYLLGAGPQERSSRVPGSA